MIFEPDPLLIPEDLIDFLGEARVKTWKVLPKSDDGITLVLYCPDRGDYGAKFAKLFGEELNRTIEFIPIDFDRLMRAIDTQNYPTLINCDSEFKFQCPQTWPSFELTNKSTVRFCNVCKKKVFWCNSPDEIRAFEPRGRCMAVRNFSHHELVEDVPYWD